MIQWLVQLVRQIQHKLEFMYEALRLVIQLLRNLLENQAKILELELKAEERDAQSAEVEAHLLQLSVETATKVEQILARLTSSTPTKFTITLIGGDMTPRKVGASLDFQLLDNGTAKAVATPDDAAGLPAQLPAGVTPTWTSSDPGVLIIADPSDASGLSATVTPATPPMLVTGAVISISATLPDNTVISGSSDPIDVVAGGPSQFKIALQ